MDLVFAPSVFNILNPFEILEELPNLQKFNTDKICKKAISFSNTALPFL